MKYDIVDKGADGRWHLYYTLQTTEPAADTRNISSRRGSSRNQEPNPLANIDATWAWAFLPGRLVHLAGTPAFDGRPTLKDFPESWRAGKRVIWP